MQWSATATGEQDFPVKWFKFIHPSPKPRMTETSFQKPVHATYSPIAPMKYKWTINLHDGYRLFHILPPEEYIPPSLHTLCNLKPTMFHLGDDYSPHTHTLSAHTLSTLGTHTPSTHTHTHTLSTLSTHKFLLPPEDNGEKLSS